MSANKRLAHNIPLLKQALAVMKRGQYGELKEFAEAKGCSASAIRHAIRTARRDGRLPREDS